MSEAGETISERRRVSSRHPPRDKGKSSDLVPVQRTHQEPPDLHEIWDHQLVALMNTNRDKFADRMWFLFGIAVALTPTCGETIWGYFRDNTPITILHLMELIVFGLSIGAGIAIYLMSGARENRSEEIARQVRGQARGSQIS
jgi:hypothetical protein